MADRENCVKVTGFPHGLSDVKVKLWIEKHIGSGSVKSIRNYDDHTTIEFFDTEGLRKFGNADIDGIEFGKALHKITILRHEDTEQNDRKDPLSNVEAETDLINKRMEKLFLQISQKDLGSREFNWSELPVPLPENMLCALAHNINLSENSLEKVKTYFSVTKRSGGGPVKGLIRMIDGLLVIFENKSDCESCIEKKNQYLSEKKLIIFRKMVPEFHANKFVLEGVAASTKNDTLVLHLESCSSLERTPICKPQASPGVYLIEYDQILDGTESTQLIEKINSKMLEGNTLKASCLIKTDCLRIPHVAPDISNDAIRLFFESKKHTNGGPVTRIDRFETKHALVYFALYKDAESVHQKFQHSPDAFVICDAQVLVEFYYHALADDHTKNIIQNFQPLSRETRDIKEYRMQTSCNKAILRYVFEKKNHSEALEKEFEYFAKVQVLAEDYSEIKFTEIKQGLVENGSAEVFSAKCSKKLDEFLSHFTTVVKTFETKKLERARSYGLCTKIMKTFMPKVDDDVIVCWETDGVTVKITGEKSSVDEVLEEITKQVALLILDIANTTKQYRIYVCCAIIDELQKLFPRVKIECNQTTCLIKITGPESDVNTVHVKALQMSNEINRRDLAEMDESIVSFILDNLRYGSTLDIKLQQKFDSSGVKGVLELDDDKPWLWVRPNADYKKAIDVIKETIEHDNIPIDKPESEVLKSAEWKRFIQQNCGLNKIKDTPRTIEVTGLKEDVQIMKQKILIFLDEEYKRTCVMPMTLGAARFVIEHSREFTKQACLKKGIECSLASESRVGVILSGKKNAFNNAKSEIGEILENMIEVKHELKEPGVKEHFTDDFLEKLSNETSCVILDESLDQKNVFKPSQDQIKSVEQSMAQAYKAEFTISTPMQTSLKSNLKKSGESCEIKLILGDISTYRADVIVNPTAPKLLTDMANGPIVSKTLAAKAGPNVQRQCKDLQPPHELGKVYTTDGGRLPCSKIFHALVEKFNDRSESVIKSVVSECLKIAEQCKFSSIAFPAIATGGFSHPPNLVARWMKEQIEKFKGQHLKKVLIVLYHKHESAVKAFSAEFNAVPESAGSSLVNSKSKQGGTNCEIIIGDIASHQADVTVNVTAPEYLTDMANGPAVSKSLARKAGQSVLQECKGIASPHVIGKVYETSGGQLSCMRIYHALVSKYDPNKSKSIIKSLILKCLKKADCNKYSSIAFPAIATGGFNHPPDLIAKWLQDGISNFSGQFLKTVYIVLYPGNQSVIDAFQKQFIPMQGGSSPSSSSKSSPTRPTLKVNQMPNANSIKVGTCEVQLNIADLVAQKADVIVNATLLSGLTDMTNGPVISRALAKIAGSDVQQQCQKLPKPHEIGKIYETDGGGLSCKKIYHVPISYYDNNSKSIIESVVLDCLKMADKDQHSSIAFSAIATGGFKYPPLLVAKWMKQQIENFKGQSVKKVFIVLYPGNKSVIDSFKAEFSTTGNERSSLMQKSIPQQNTITGRRQRLGFLFALFEKETPQKTTKVDGKEHTFKLLIYSTEKESTDKAIRKLSIKVSEITDKLCINETAFSRFTKWERFELEDVEKKTNINMSCANDKIELSGLKENVRKAENLIRVILNDFLSAEKSVTYVSWEKKHADKWEKYPARSAYVLETAYLAYQKGGSSSTVISVPELKKNYLTHKDVDISPLFDNTSNDSLKVRRCISEDYPSYWDDMKKEPIKKVQLTSTSKEYQDVLTTLQANGLDKATVVSIERIQNKLLYNQYNAKKVDVTSRLQNFDKAIERKLFHGTTADEKIIIHGFDRSYAGKNGTKFGVGVYFAQNAGYSHKYTEPNPNDERKMFLADVITGKYCKGNDKMEHPPPVQNGSGTDNVYNSVVDDVANPTVFVVFRDPDAYPAYRITYKM